MVATSALELGIDMPDLSYGIQLDLPQSRKQFHQRLGRVGRSKPGKFILLAPADRLAFYGDTLSGYLDKMVEPSHLYLGNEYISYAQALCLNDELRRRGKPGWDLPSICQWPEGFARSLAATQGMTPEHLMPITSYTKDRNPHLAYSIRSTGEDTLTIYEQNPRSGAKENEREIGDISVSAAMQEAYPGAIYRHRGDSYRVEEWARRKKTRDPFIRATRIRDTAERTRPVLQRVVEINATPELVLGDRYETASIGAIGLVMAQITESVEGYSTIRGGWTPGGDQDPVIYRTASQQDPRKTRKQRTFPTTAMVIRINEDWFKGHQGEPVLARLELAEAIRRQLAYQRSIALQDLKATSKNILVGDERGFYLADDTIVIYDNIYGGLGLVESIYENLESYADWLCASQADNGWSEELLQQEHADKFRQWLTRGEDTPTGGMPEPTEADWWRVIPHGTSVHIVSPETERPVLGKIAAKSWQDGVQYQVNTEEDNYLVWEDRIITGGGADWQIWQPETGVQRHFEWN